MGGGVAAVLECLGADHGPMPPVVLAGAGLGLGIGMLVASVVSAGAERYGPALMPPVKR